MSPAFAQAPVTPSLLIGAPNDRVRVMIRLATPFQAEGFLSAPAALLQRQTIARLQADGHALLQSLGLKPVAFATLPWMATEMTRAQVQALANHPLVAAVDEDVIVRTSLAESVPRIGAPQVWSAGVTGSGWTVAVLDTGADRGHPFLASAIVHEACFSTSGTDSASLCPGGSSSATGGGAAAACPPGVAGCEHGTHVAGIAAGRDPSQNLYGVARGASLLPIQVFSRFDNANICAPLAAPCALAYMSDVGRGLDYVMTAAGSGNSNRIAAVNLSLAGATYSGACDGAPGMPAVKTAIDNLRSIGIATVIAAGNQGYNGAIGAPACISTAVSVGSTEDSSDTLSYFSNHSAQLQLGAPGSVIYSSLPGGRYGHYAGTSMAAPHVAGAWTLLKQLMPGASVTTVLNALRSTGAAIDGRAAGETFTRIRVDQAAAQLLPATAPSAPRGLVANVTESTITISWQPPSTGAVATYVVAAGSTPGGTSFFNGAVGAGTAVAAQVPAGTYYIRVRAQNGTGTSSPSNEVTATVTGPATAAPGAPQNVAASVAGATITLGWAAPTTGGAASNFIVQAGSTPGGADFFNGPVGNVTAVAAAVPSGTYYIRVIALNSLGASAPSVEATAIVTGGCNLPLASTLAGSAAVGTANVMWTTPANGPVTGYLLQAGRAPGTSDFFNGPVGNTNAVSAVVAPGTYHVRVRGMSACGVGAASNEVVLTVQ